MYAEILKVDPGDADALFGEAEIEAWRGYRVALLETLNQLVKDDPGNMDVRTLQGDINANWD